MTQMVEDEEGDLEQDNPGNADPLLEQGDHLFATMPAPNVPVIASTMMTSQQLTERSL